MRKGIAPQYLLGIIMLVVLVVLGMIAINNYGFEKIRAGADLSACDAGVDAVTSGMCTDYTFCPSNGQSKGESGCPSALFKEGSDGKGLDTSDYDLCCIVDSCSDIVDDLNGGSIPRVEITDLSKNQDKCVGFARDCNKEGDCCCGIGDK